MEYNMSSYPYWGEHGTVGLLIAIIHLEKYPQFESIIPKLKKELEIRFKEIKLNKKGMKVLGKIKYYPSGYCRYEKYSYEGGGHIDTTISPFKAKIEKKKGGLPKRKTSQARLMYRHNFCRLPIFYRLCAYDKVGMKVRIRKNNYMYFNEENAHKFLDKEKDVLGTAIPDNIKQELLGGVLRGLFNYKDWKYQKDGYNIKNGFEYILIEEFADRFLGCKNCSRESELKIGPVLIINGNEAYYYKDDDHNGEKIYINMDTKYRLIFPLPMRDMIKGVAETGQLPRIKKDYDSEQKKYIKRVPECQVATLNFDTFDEFLTQFKSTMYSLKNQSLIKIMKNIGVKVEKDKELKEIKNVSIITSARVDKNGTEKLVER